MEILDIKEFDTQNCPIFRSVREVGDYWMMLIIREAFMGKTRFADFQNTLNISKSVLTKKIKQLVEKEILTKQAYQEPNQRKRFEYLLTQKGRDLYLIIMALMQWGNKYLIDETGDRMKMIDRQNQSDLSLAFVNEEGEIMTRERLQLLLYK